MDSQKSRNLMSCRFVLIGIKNLKCSHIVNKHLELYFVEILTNLKLLTYI